MKKIIDGFIFGFGFGVAFLLVVYVGFSELIFQKLALLDSTTISVGDRYEPSNLPSSKDDSIMKMPFHDLGIEDQIKYSSVIAVAKYEPGPDGKMKAVITEILKVSEKTEFNYSVGDEYSQSSYYPKNGESRGDGVVMFLVGSPAKMKMTMSFNGDRIGGLGDLPIELFRKKCKEAGA